MLFVIIGHDGPNGATLRPTVRPRHLAYVGPVAQSGKMLIGGPFTDGSGSLIIVDMESEAAGPSSRATIRTRSTASLSGSRSNRSARCCPNNRVVGLDGRSAFRT